LQAAIVTKCMVAIDEQGEAALQTRVAVCLAVQVDLIAAHSGEVPVGGALSGEANGESSVAGHAANILFFLLLPCGLAVRFFASSLSHCHRYP
jgi:hypothetical protein